jgi:diacylglycerol kinase (ATP)
LGCSSENLKPFQRLGNVEWQLGLPASAEEADVILLFGGDGTIHRHLNQLVRLGLPVLIVPSGSGNDFAQALGLRKVRDSLSAWKAFCEGAAQVRAIDLGLILENAGGAPAPHTHYFCSVAGIGLDGEVTRRANRLPRWLRRHGGYVLSLAPTVFTYAPSIMKIRTPAEDRAAEWTVRSNQPTLLVAFANTSSFGDGMKIAPRAQMDDGLLDVCVVGKVGTLRLLRLFPSVYSGAHLKLPEVQYFQAGCVRVESERALDVYADGEYVCGTPVEFGVQRGALKVVRLS